jgi:hypothetical protein
MQTKKWLPTLSQQSLLIAIGVAVIVLMAGVAVNAQAHERQAITIKVEDGPSGAARPDLDYTKVELTFHDVSEGSARIVLHSPARKWYSPTDFPHVEGTMLIDSTLEIKEGKAQFQYMFPIRGDYRMLLDVQDETGRSLGTQEVALLIKENAKEVQNAVIFIGILAGFGLLCGWALSRRRLGIHAA